MGSQMTFSKRLKALAKVICGWRPAPMCLVITFVAAIKQSTVTLESERGCLCLRDSAGGLGNRVFSQIRRLEWLIGPWLSDPRPETLYIDLGRPWYYPSSIISTQVIQAEYPSTTRVIATRHLTLLRRFSLPHPLHAHLKWKSEFSQRIQKQ